MQHIVLFLLMMVSSLSSLAFGDGYDELRNSKGEIRPHYRVPYTFWSSLTEEEQERLFQESFKAFKGDNYLNTMPLVLTEKDYFQVVKPGVEQRARAIRAFLMDHYSSEKSYLKKGIIPKAVIDRALDKVVEKGFEGKLPPETISFFYGPDLVRDSKGTYRVIEDNPGYIGILGDLNLAFEQTLKNFPDLAEYMVLKHPRKFYEDIIRIFSSVAGKHSGRVVMYVVPPFPDNEDFRLKEIFGKLGVITVTPNSRHQLKINDDGVYVYDKKFGYEATHEKVGFVIMNGEHLWLDPSHPETRKQLIVDEAKDHLADKNVDQKTKKNIRAALEYRDPKTGEYDYDLLLKNIKKSNLGNSIADLNYQSRMAHGLVQKTLEGKVSNSYSPGVNFIGDKEFYIYVPELIRYYLKEEPILKNIETDSFADARGALKTDLMAKVFSDFRNYVVKGTAGRGGDSVWVGPFAKSEDIAKLKTMVQEHPEEYIVQEFSPLSQLQNLIVDMRVFSYVDKDHVYVGDQPGSRGLPTKDKNGKSVGNGKVNLSDKGRELPIFIYYGQHKLLCAQAFSSL